MGAVGKKYPKTRMRVLMNKYGTYDKIAEAVGLTAGTVRRIADGNTTHAPTRAKLNVIWTRIKKKAKKKKAKKAEVSGNGTAESRFHQLTEKDVHTLQGLVETFGEDANTKLGVSPEGFKLMLGKGVGGNVMRDTGAKILSAEKLVPAKKDETFGRLLNVLKSKKEQQPPPNDGVIETKIDAIGTQVMENTAKLNTLLEQLAQFFHEMGVKI